MAKFFINNEISNSAFSITGGTTEITTWKVFSNSDNIEPDTIEIIISLREV